MGPHGTARPARDGTTRADLGSLAQVSDTPEEPVEGEPGPEEGGGGDDADSPLRGWIDPDDRLWRHPSEVPTAADPAGPVVLQPPEGKRHRTALMALVAAAAVVGVVAFVVLLLSPTSDHPSTGGPSDTVAAAPVSTLPGLQNAVPAVALAAGRSMVELQATTSHGIVALIGIAVAEGGLVVTTADALGGLEHISLVGPGGTLESASVLGRDRESDVALVQVPEDVPVAPFSDGTGLSAAAADLTRSPCAPSGPTSCSARSPARSALRAPPSPMGRPAACRPSPPVCPRSAARRPWACRPHRALLSSTRPGRSSRILYDPEFQPPTWTCR